MNFEWFTVRRIIATGKHKGSVSAPIIKIAIAAIAAGMTIMLLSVATGFGLQEKIREKVMAFNGAVTLTHLENQGQLEDVIAWELTSATGQELSTVDGVSHTQATAHKPGLIMTDQTFEGIVLKGVGPDYQWSYLNEFLESGRWLEVEATMSNGIVLSRLLADRMNLGVGSRLNTYFFDQNKVEEFGPSAKARGFEVVGIYDSGFEEFDAQMAFVDLRHIQRLNRWPDGAIGMIGLFQSMGTGNWRIQKIFLLQAGYIILWGLFWGNLFGLGLIWAQDTWELINLDPKTYYVTQAPVYLPFVYWGLLNLGTLMLCLLFLLLPSYLVAKISPVSAMRFDG
ncbi:MAG: FtsX-like permease family protein [Flavobacteriaceae bacterium]|nr:FtsX-like permease family protein [Flavobacteriaceae bacterium]